jgi:DNA invertase Pin-like site-specific DNA recombinase
MHVSDFHPHPDTIGYSYIRFSSVEQRKGDSERRQIAATKTLATKLGVVIDEKLSQKDLGKSGYHGDHLESGLGRFLALIANGTVAKGSILFVENLDRLSRQKPMKAFNLFSNIIESGITIITTSDGQVYTSENIDKNGYQLFGIIAVMMRANEESEIKSQRAKARYDGAWSKYKDTGKINHWMISQTPSWITKQNGTFVLNGWADVVRDVVGMTIDGLSPATIAKKLNAEKVPHPKNGLWQRCTIAYWISSEALIGRVKTSRGTVDAIPAVISPDQWDKLQGRLGLMRKSRKPGCKPFVNPFGKLLVDGWDKTTMRVTNNGTKQMASKATYLGHAPRRGHIPFQPFAQFILGFIGKERLTECLQVDDGQEQINQRQKLEGELAGIDNKLQTINGFIANTDNDLISLLETVKTLESKRHSILKSLESIKSDQHKPQIESGEIPKLVAKLWNGNGDESDTARARLTLALAATFKSITVWHWHEGKTKDKRVVILCDLALVDGRRKGVVFTIRNRQARYLHLLTDITDKSEKALHWMVKDLAGLQAA